MKGPAKGGIVGTVILIAAVTVAFMVSGADFMEAGPVKIGKNPEPDSTSNSTIISKGDNSVNVIGNGNTVIQEPSTEPKESEINVNIMSSSAVGTTFTISNSKGGIALVDDISLVVKNVTKIDECNEPIPISLSEQRINNFGLGSVVINKEQHSYPLIDQKDEKYYDVDGYEKIRTDYENSEDVEPSTFYYNEGNIDQFRIIHSLAGSYYNPEEVNYLYDDKLQHKWFYSNPDKINYVYYNDVNNKYEYVSDEVLKELETFPNDEVIMDLIKPLSDSSPETRKTESYSYDVAISVDWCDPIDCKNKKTYQTDFETVKDIQECLINIDFNEEIIQLRYRN